MKISVIKIDSRLQFQNERPYGMEFVKYWTEKQTDWNYFQLSWIASEKYLSFIAEAMSDVREKFNINAVFYLVFPLRLSETNGDFRNVVFWVLILSGKSNHGSFSFSHGSDIRLSHA